MDIPVDLPHMHQELVLVTKDDNGTMHSETLLAVAFVPFIRPKKGIQKMRTRPRLLLKVNISSVNFWLVFIPSSAHISKITYK